MSNGFDVWLEDGGIQTLFQPIVDRVTREAYGLEALTRGPVGTELHPAAALFAAAAECGRSLDLERACIASALRAFSALETDSKLFLNVLPQSLLQWDGFARWLDEQLARSQVDPHSVVLELTEHGTQQHESQLASAIAPLRALGCDIAIDDLGAGASGLKTWSAIRPEYVKVDRYFVAGIEEDPVRGEILRSVVEMGRATGSRVVAEGIENREQCGIVCELGVDYMQGHFLGRPQSVPRVERHEAGTFPGAGAGAVADCAEHLARPIPPVPGPTLIAAVIDKFRTEADLTAVAVVDGNRPVGLVRRDDLLILYSKPLHPEVYGRKPVTAVMDRRAVQIDARARLEQVSRLVTGGRESCRREEFIITSNGAYLGLGHTIDLLHQITTQQLQAARHSNPLTGLPGNREIHAQLAQLIARGRPFVACHLDLDHFKAFNDTYGYSRGDQVLLHVAQAITGNVRPRVDFVGHVGGDDFVFFLRSQDWVLRLTELLQELAASLGNFHSSEHREAGGYRALGRDGASRHFPLLSVSIGAVAVEGGTGTDWVADELRRAKSAAKSQHGNSCMLSSGGRVLDLWSRGPTGAEDLPELPEMRLGDTTIRERALIGRD